MCLCSPPDSSWQRWLIIDVEKFWSFSKWWYNNFQGWILITLIYIIITDRKKCLRSWGHKKITLFIEFDSTSALPMCVSNSRDLKVQIFFDFRPAKLLQCYIRHAQYRNLKTNRSSWNTTWAGEIRSEQLKLQHVDISAMHSINLLEQMSTMSGFADHMMILTYQCIKQKNMNETWTGCWYDIFLFTPCVIIWQMYFEGQHILILNSATNIRHCIVAFVKL